MRILALDQSSRITGWAVFEEDRLIKYGTYTTKKSNIEDRLYEIRQKIESLIEEYSIDTVILEDIQMQDNVIDNVSTFKKLAEVLGVLQELCVELEKPCHLVHSTVWKSALGIKGHDRSAQKKSAWDWTNKTYNIATTQDAADAICIGTYFVRQIIKPTKPVSKVEVFDWS